MSEQSERLAVVETKVESIGREQQTMKTDLADLGRSVTALQVKVALFSAGGSILGSALVTWLLGFARH